MFGECHAHALMNSVNYRAAVELHKEKVNESAVRKCLEAYKEAGVSFVRDGGDPYGVSELAAKLAPEYGIDYRTPIFAIHKNGHYGSIVGRGFADIKEFHQRVKEAKEAGADFIKIMTTGLLDFNNHGRVTGTPLEAKEVKEMVHIAHEEGFAVMSHTNGAYGTRAAIEAGVDSLEHGNYMDEETVTMLAESSTVWVPTLVTIGNLIGCGRFPDKVLTPLLARQMNAVKKAAAQGARIACGSDAGAYRVLHGQGGLDELALLRRAVGAQADAVLAAGNAALQARF